MELWKDIKGYERKYQVSNKGRVKSLTRKILVERKGVTFYQTYHTQILSLHIVCNYVKVTLSNNKISKSISVHRLVAKEFILNKNNLPHINHKDGNKLNNVVNNLEWCDRYANMRHASQHNLLNLKRGEVSHHCKLKSDDIINIRKLHSKKYPQSKLAKKYGVSTSCIYKIVHRIKWKHI
jgi:hypothetical protein